jgi:hypothetical protein
MARGLLGAPRLTSAGPLVEEATSKRQLPQDVQFRPHSYREWSPEEFLEWQNQGIPPAELRDEMRFIESGRMDNMLKALHKFWIPLDPDEKETFSQRNPGLMQWLEAWASLEGLRPPSEDVDVSF